LRRALVTRKIVTEPLREYNTGVAVSGIKPESIPLDVKVILIGSGYYYHILYAYDDYFEKLFKTRVDFDYEMKLNAPNVAEIVRFIRQYKASDTSPPAVFTPDAIAAVIEYAARLAERQDKLTTRFNRLQDLLAEASALAAGSGDGAKVTKTHIRDAIAAREYRINMYEEKLSERMEEDSIMISTDGAKVGQINSLAVLDTGEHVFAVPSRITATAYMGKSGVINIEKEANLSGKSTTRGYRYCAVIWGKPTRRISRCLCLAGLPLSRITAGWTGTVPLPRNCMPYCRHCRDCPSAKTSPSQGQSTNTAKSNPSAVQHKKSKVSLTYVKNAG